MRYIQYCPSINGEQTFTSPYFLSEKACDDYCIEMNQAMVADYEAQGLQTPLHRYKTLKVIRWTLLVCEISIGLLTIVFFHKWTHGHYESAICALAARVMLFGLPVVSLTKL